MPVHFRLEYFPPPFHAASHSLLIGLSAQNHIMPCHVMMTCYVMSCRHIGGGGSTHDRRHRCFFPVIGTGTEQPPPEFAIIVESTVDSICCIVLIPQPEALSAPNRASVRRKYEVRAGFKTSSKLLAVLDGFASGCGCRWLSTRVAGLTGVRAEGWAESVCERASLCGVRALNDIMMRVKDSS